MPPRAFNCNRVCICVTLLSCYYSVLLVSYTFSFSIQRRTLVRSSKRIRELSHLHVLRKVANTRTTGSVIHEYVIFTKKGTGMRTPSRS